MQEDDQRLVKRSQEGDLDAFNRLVERYQGQVYGLAFHMLGNRASAEDVTQDSLTSAYRNIRRFRGGNLRAWLLRIARNACLDAMRSSKRRPELSLDASMLDPGFDVPSREESPEEYAMRRELRSEIQRALASLPEDQRLAVTLVDLQGLSYEEAAEAARASLGTLKSRISRGRFRLRDYLLQRRELLPDEFRLSK